jgi:hypothetical protein
VTYSIIALATSVAVRSCAAQRSGQSVGVTTARHLRPGAHDVASALRRRAREVWPMRRRGADLGFAVPVSRTMPSRRVAETMWRDAEPVFLPGMLGTAPRRYGAAIRQSLAMFDRLRAGGALLDEIEPRLADDADFEYVGSADGGSDVRDIERVYLDAVPNGQRMAKDLWALLASLATGEADASLRIRFSSGSENLDEWMRSTDLTAGWVDRFATRAFPECAAILGCRPLRELLQHLLGRPYRLSERIVYNNAPNGGAVFHHDAEPGQLGVVFSQLEGHTAWLALSKQRLAALLTLRGHARSTREALLDLDRGEDPLRKVLNRDAVFTAELAARGALFVLRAGDSLLLPSHGTEDVAWHSVIALGDRPSLAHSYGIFARGEDYPVVADPWHPGQLGASQQLGTSLQHGPPLAG